MTAQPHGASRKEAETWRTLLQREVTIASMATSELYCLYVTAYDNFWGPFNVMQRSGGADHGSRISAGGTPCSATSCDHLWPSEQISIVRTTSVAPTYTIIHIRQVI
jgi:hypothetical protein